MQTIVLLLFVLSFIGCASTQETVSVFSLSEEQYEEKTEPFSASIQKYDGPYNILDANATLLNSFVIEAQLQRQATVFQWSKSKYEEELLAKQNQTKDKTEFFVGFFTPDKKSSELTRTDTLWKILLKVNGREYLGTPKKLSLLPVEIKNLYPKHNRWSNPYLVTFEIPLVEVEKNSAELVLTGPVGSASLQFLSPK